MDKNKIEFLKKDDKVIYWDKEKRRFFYCIPSENYNHEIMMYRPGNYDLELEDLEHIYSFITLLVALVDKYEKG